jgi:hypothetical protein
MPADPRGKARLVEIAGGEREHRQGRIGLRRFEPVSVQAEEEANTQETSALVAVDERVVPDQPPAIGRGEIGKVGLAVREQVLRARARRFEEPFVTQAHAAAMLGETFVVQELERAAIDPAPRHLASW